MGRNSPFVHEMANDEAPMTNEVRMTNDEHPHPQPELWFRAWALIGHWGFGIRHFRPGSG
jgi:hypothetical protein